jgi:hypothetical protein
MNNFVRIFLGIFFIASFAGTASAEFDACASANVAVSGQNYYEDCADQGISSEPPGVWAPGPLPNPQVGVALSTELTGGYDLIHWTLEYKSNQFIAKDCLKADYVTPGGYSTGVVSDVSVGGGFNRVTCYSTGNHIPSSNSHAIQYFELLPTHQEARVTLEEAAAFLNSIVVEFEEPQPGAPWINRVFIAPENLDTDVDGFANGIDNCSGLAILNQAGTAYIQACDDDQDGYGNACDGDFDQNFAVGVTDHSTFVSSFGGSVSDYGEDLDCNGGVGVTDFSTFVELFWAVPPRPGPSGLLCAGTAPCN